MTQGSLNSQPPRRKCRLIPLGATVPADGLVTAAPKPNAQPSGTVYVMRIESSALVSAHPGWPTQTPQGSGCAGSNGLAVWVPAASRSPITSNDALGVGVVLAAGLDGLVVGVGATLGAAGLGAARVSDADSPPDGCPLVQPVNANTAHTTMAASVPIMSTPPVIGIGLRASTGSTSPLARPR